MMARISSVGDSSSPTVDADDSASLMGAEPLGSSVDLATLSWCVGEIRDALYQTENALDAQRLAQDGDTAALKLARLQLHQAHGALLVVDVPAASVLTEEAEAVLAAISTGAVKLDASVMNALRAAFAACIEYLDDLLQAQPDHPLYLFPYLQTLRKLRSADREHPADLFFPDLTRRLPESIALPQVSVGSFDPADAPDAAEARKAFEKGLLKFLREPTNSRGVDYMLGAVSVVERFETDLNNRNFWRVALAFLEAVRRGQLAADVYTKRLLARLNLQLRKSVNEGIAVADRLMQDTLYGLASARGGSPLIDTVRSVYGLDGVVPSDFMTPRYGRHDSRTIRAARDALNQARIAWDSVSRGHPADAGGLVQSLTAFQTAAKHLPAQGLQSLASVLVDTGQAMASQHELFDAPVALEAATAILFADQILEQGGRAGEAFDSKAAELAVRLSRALTGGELGAVPGWLQSLSAAAQDRMTMDSFVRETLVSLRAAEQDLDGFFRDYSKRAQLPDAARQLAQVSGALQLLGHQSASDGAQATAIIVSGFAESSNDPDAADCERVASNCGALGFFVEGLQQAHRPSGLFEFDALSGEFRARLAEAPRAFDTVDQMRVADHKQQAGDLLASLQQTPTDNQVREQLRGALEQVRDDALLRDDDTLKKQAAAAIDLLAIDSQEGIAQLSEALAKMSPPVAQAATLQQMQIPDDAAAIDQELLEIFLAEAHDVLETIEQASAASRRAPSDQQCLTTIRRGFHTLKGSSRMVGLNAFGEAGWALEQVMNLLLSEERSGDVDLYALIDAAREQMLDWVQCLEHDPASRVEPAALISAAEAYRVTGQYTPVEIDLAAQPPIDEDSPIVVSDDPLTIDDLGIDGLALDAAAEPDDLQDDATLLAAFDLDAAVKSVLADQAVAPEANAAFEPSVDAETGAEPLVGADPLASLDIDESVEVVAPIDLSTLEGFDVPIELASLDDLLDTQPPTSNAHADQALVVDEPIDLPVQQMPTSAADALDVSLDAINWGDNEAPADEGDVGDLVELTDRIEVPESSDLLRPVDLAELGLAPSQAQAPHAVFEPLAPQRPTGESPAVLALETIDLDVLGAHAEPDMAVDTSAFNAQMDQIVAELLRASPRSASAYVPSDVDALSAEPSRRADLEALSSLEGASASSSAFVSIGDQTISRPLYLIFLSEAEGLIATLAKDIEAWRAQPDRLASEGAARAAHSLCGSASLVGLNCVHDLVGRLEEVLLTQTKTAFALMAGDFTTMSHAVDCMKVMLEQFADGRMPAEDADALDGLALLHLRMLALHQSSDGSPQAVTLPRLDSDIDTRDDAQSLEIESDANVLVFEDDAEIDALAKESAKASLVPVLAINEESAAPVIDELDAELLPIFIEEADDLLPAMGTDLRRWAEDPADAARARNLMRALHTVKGSARMAGAMNLGQLVHEMETRIEALTILPIAPRAMIDELIADHDQVMSLFEQIKNPAAVKVTPGESPVVTASLDDTATTSSELTTSSSDSSSSRPGKALFAGPASDVSSVPSSTAAALPALGAGLAKSTARPVASPIAAKPSTQLVRVRADLLDRVVNEAGEASIARSKLDNELSSMRLSLADLTENVNRLRTQLREIEIHAESQIQAQTREADRSFDPLEFDRYTRFQELTRMMAESVNDVATVQHNAGRNLDEAAQELVRQGQVLRDLQQNLMRVRMVQFGTIADRLFRVARQAAKETGKRVNLDVRGSTVEVDRSVLEKMAGPLEHLVRNAVAHGIEAREVRQSVGKAETGEIRVEVRQEGNEIILIMADDGGGLDLQRIRARAVANGLIAEDAVLGDRELRDLIFAPGFTTADKVTELSGRGVGMDVVRVETSALGGRIEIDSQPGHGSRFTIHLPLTLAVAQVVLMGAAGARFAVPSSSVEQVLQFKPQALAAGYTEGHFEWQGNRVPLFYLGALVELQDRSPVAQHYSPVAILRAANQRIALHVDTLARNQEVVVKNVGPQVSRVSGVSGATVLGNGDIVLIINPVKLAIEAVGPSLDALSASVPMVQRIALEMPASVMVVDDSVTVRKVTQRLLAREGYQVLLAKDGVDALRQMQDTVPDVMLVDIEMPRMDGFDLTRAVRSNARYAAIPIVMITSRTADKHRNMAFELGVNAYLGKPYSEDGLLRQIDGLLKGKGSATAATD